MNDCQGSLGVFALIVTLATLNTYEGTTDWYPANVKPVHVGIYRVRLPLQTVEMSAYAEWDGTLWRDVTNGLECYFQNMQWQGLTARGEA